MKLTFFAAAILISPLVTFASASDSGDVQILDPYQKVFQLPIDATQVTLSRIERTKIATKAFKKEVSCGGDSIGACYDFAYEYEPAIRIDFRYISPSSRQSEEGGSDFSITTYFHESEFTTEELAGIPKIGFFGNGSQANREYANRLLQIQEEKISVTVPVIDVANSTVCPIDDYTGNKDSGCQDHVVYKDQQVEKIQITLTHR